MAYFHTTVLDEQIKALPTVDTASGSIATFDTDLTENLVEVKCQIVAKQASGTPSPDNPLPITDYNGLNLSATGKNLFNPLTQFIDMGSYMVAKNVTPNTPCTMSFSDKDTSVDISDVYFGFIDSEYVGGLPAHFKWIINKGQIDAGNKTNVDTLHPPTTICTGLFAYPNTQTAIDKIMARYDIQIELGKTATDYEPYNGTTANIPFGQTVANGVLDVTTGKLSFEKVGVTLNPSLNWTKNAGIGASYAFICSAQFPNYIRRNGICSHFPVASSSLDVEGVFFGVGINILTPLSLGLDTETKFKQWITDNTVQVVYSINPQTVQLDSTQITALLNENNIWCDTGDTEVKYLLTVGKKIS